MGELVAARLDVVARLRLRPGVGDAGLLARDAVGCLETGGGAGEVTLEGRLHCRPGHLRWVVWRRGENDITRMRIANGRLMLYLEPVSYSRLLSGIDIVNQNKNGLQDRFVGGGECDRKLTEHGEFTLG